MSLGTAQTRRTAGDESHHPRIPIGRALSHQAGLTFFRAEGGISGTAAGEEAAGRLFFFNGDERDESLSGGPVIAPKTWNHVRLVRRGEQVAVTLNGDAQPVLSGELSVTRPAGCRDVFVGGRSDNFANFEGRLAEVAVYARRIS